jgi:hypothetical protein
MLIFQHQCFDGEATDAFHDLSPPGRGRRASAGWGPQVLLIEHHVRLRHPSPDERFAFVDFSPIGERFICDSPT